MIFYIWSTLGNTEVLVLNVRHYTSTKLTNSHQAIRLSNNGNSRENICSKRMDGNSMMRWHKLGSLKMIQNHLLRLLKKFLISFWHWWVAKEKTFFSHSTFFQSFDWFESHWRQLMNSFKHLTLFFHGANFGTFEWVFIIRSCEFMNSWCRDEYEEENLSLWVPRAWRDDRTFSSWQRVKMPPLLLLLLLQQSTTRTSSLKPDRLAGLTADDLWTKLLYAQETITFPGLPTELRTMELRGTAH